MERTDEIGLWCSSFHHYIEYSISDLPLLDVKLSNEGILVHEFWTSEMPFRDTFGHTLQLEVS